MATRANGTLTALMNGPAEPPATTPPGLRVHDIETAKAVLESMANGLTAKEAATKHGLKERWCDGLVTDPPKAVRDAPWYRAAVAPVKERRAKRRGGRALVLPGARRV